nr:MAG TPA: hypothetical protein [Caudoviricetes sp.]
MTHIPNRERKAAVAAAAFYISLPSPQTKKAPHRGNPREVLIFKYALLPLSASCRN